MTSLQVKVHSEQGEYFGLYCCVLIILDMNKIIIHPNYREFRTCIRLKKIKGATIYMLTFDEQF